LIRLIIIFLNKFNELYNKTKDRLERFIPLITVLAFIIGIFLAKFSQGFSAVINKLVSSFVDAYGFVAPFAIFFIFAPSLAKLLSMGKAGRFGGYVIGWLAFRRFLACVWGAIFTAIIFRLPLFPEHTTSLSLASIHSLKSFLWMATHSSYFFAMY